MIDSWEAEAIRRIGVKRLEISKRLEKNPERANEEDWRKLKMLAWLETFVLVSEGKIQ